MNRRSIKVSTICVLSLFLGVWAGALRGDEAGKKRRAAKREQQQVARFLKDFHDIKDVKLKREFIDKAEAKGAPFLRGLKRKIESDVQVELRGGYGKTFLATIEIAPRIAPKSVVEANKKLGEHRGRVLLRVEWIALIDKKLKTAGTAGRLDPDERVREFENSLINQWLTAKGYGRLSNAETALVNQVNRLRAGQSLEPLVVDYKLSAAARDHSREMAAKGFLSHKSKSPNKTTFSQRASRFGAKARSENIADFATTALAMQFWISSRPHRRNMLDPAAHRVGVGVVGRKSTMLFGPKSAAAKAKPIER